MYLLIEANHTDKKWNDVLVKRGQLVTGRKKLSEKTGISIQSIRTSIARLKSTNGITIKTTNKYSIITVCNYDSYNTDQPANQPADQPADQPTTNQQLTTTKNVVELKERKRKNTLSASSKSDNGFNFSKEKPTCTEFDKRAAKYFEKAVRKLPPRKTGITKAKPASWANHILKLRIIDGIEEAEIKRTLKWYCSHIGEEYVPEAYSGESFRKKYPAILRQYEKDNPTPIETSPEAQQLAEDIGYLSWPSNAAQGLPAAIQSSLDAFGKWQSDLIAYSGKLTAKHEEWIKANLPPGRRKLAPVNTSFAEWLVSIVPGKKQFIRGWFEEVNRSVCNWNRWDGNLSRFIFRPDSKQFQKIGEKWALEFTGDSKRWGVFYNAMMQDLK